MGLCNFFRNHIRNFAQLASPLTHLSCQESNYTKGPMPEEATKAFHTLQQLLGSNPTLAFPRKDRDYVLVTESHPPSSHSDGSLSVTLCQRDSHGRYYILSHGSRQLLQHEARYPPFLLEMLAANYGMEYFDEHLRAVTSYCSWMSTPFQS